MLTATRVFISSEIMAAEIAFEKQTTYDRWAPGQPRTFAAIERMLDDREETQRKSLGIEPEVESKHASRDHLPSV